MILEREGLVLVDDLERDTDYRISYTAQSAQSQDASHADNRID